MRASVREQIILCTYIEKKVQIVSSNVSYDEHRTCCRLGRMQQLFIYDMICICMEAIFVCLYYLNAQSHHLY
jgi:hypothetical protein